MTQFALRKKLCSVALSALMATGTICAIAPNAHAEVAQQQYLATDGKPTISATADQLNLPFDPSLYYAYSLLTDAGKNVWNWALPNLLSYDHGKTYSDSAVTIVTQNNGDDYVTFNLQEKGMKATVADIKQLNNYFVWNEARLFILRDWGATRYTVDAQGNVKTIWFAVAKVWTSPGKYQKLLTQMESSVTDILANVDTRQDDAQRLNALYDNYLAKEHYINSGSPGSMPGAFINGNVICGGYSKGFEYLSMRAGVPAAYILGYAGGYHAWNAVKLDDGKWYYIDSTWDDHYGAYGYSTRTWFLKGTDKFKRTLQGGTLQPTISTTSYAMKTWVAPETVTPMANKAVDQIAAAVNKTFAAYPYLISQVTNVTVRVGGKSTSGSTFNDMFFLNNLQKNIDALKLSGTATITVSNAQGALSSVTDVMNKGLAVDYQVPGSDQKFGWVNGQFVDKTAHKVESEADVAAKVLDMGSKVATRVLEAHSAEVSDISGLMVNLPETVAYQGTTTAEKEAVAQIKANLQGKFDGELSIMVMGNYTSLDELLAKGLVVGYKAPSGKYYTLMGGTVIAS